MADASKCDICGDYYDSYNQRIKVRMRLDTYTATYAMSIDTTQQDPDRAICRDLCKSCKIKQLQATIKELEN